MEADVTRQSRREFLKTVGWTAVSAGALPVLAGCSGSKPAAKLKGRRPNILLIMSDEHNANLLGCYGNKLVQTPVLDDLAGRGILFENCYCNSPLCVPSRLSFTSGKYSSRVGAWSNSSMLPTENYPSLAGIMNASGYESFLCGKMHYDRYRRYGLKRIGGFINRNVMKGTGRRRKADDLEPQPGNSRHIDNFGTGESFVLKHDRQVTAGTLEFLKNRKSTDKPFFLVTGYIAPHYPLIVPKEYWAPYKGKVPMPVIPEGHLESQPRNYKHLRIGTNTEGLPDETVRKGREFYYGLCQWMDEQVGKVLKTLAESEFADDTIVIYTSDHGENMGEHGLWWKLCMYEHSVHVPLIISWPKRWKGDQRRTEVCSLVDLAQTIAELVEVEVGEDWDGDSMVAWMDDGRGKWKDFAVSEYYATHIASGFVMIRAGRYKYVYHTRADAEHGPQRELYDLQTDLGEFNNLAGQAKHKNRIAKMHDKLVEELGEDLDSIEQRCRADYAVGYVRDVIK